MKQEEVSMEQWAMAVALTKRFTQSKPWEQFEDMELFALRLPSQKKKVYASIMGFHKMCYGLSFYEGKEGFKDLSSVAFEMDNMAFQNYLAMQSSFFSVYFDDQDNVSYEQACAYKKLGLDKAEYPHFSVKEKSCFPDDPTHLEMDKYITYMAALLEAVEFFLKEEVIIDFHKSLFSYDVLKHCGKPQPLRLEPRMYDPILPNNEDLLEHMAKKESNGEVWEMEFNYINQGSQRKDGRVENVRLVMCACLDDHSMLSCVPVEGKVDENEVVLDTFFQLIERYGRPIHMQVCNLRLLPILGPTCDRLHIALDLVEDFEIIEEFLIGLQAFSAKEDNKPS